MLLNENASTNSEGASVLLRAVSMSHQDCVRELLQVM